MMADPDADRVGCEHEHAAGEAAALDEANLERAAALFRAVGDPARLRLLYVLSTRDEICVSEIAAMFGEGMSTVSQRLRLLRSERLVRGERRGKHVYYALADHHVIDIIRDALAHVSEE
jgi:ArsR family transcriptional regulator, lead/cadmium/zinc/bismuth-responsive transcriptional repressor